MEDCKKCLQYVKELEKVEIDELLGDDDYDGNIDLKWERTNGIITDILDKYYNPKIIDFAVGGGADTLFLLKKGYKVASNDINDYFIKVIQNKAKKINLPLESLDIRIEDWRNILTSKKYKDEEFDFAFILGNSFPNYFFNKEDREKSLKGFWRTIKPGGVLFFDTRNFDYMLSQKENILKNPEDNFKYIGNNTYLKSEIYKIFPVKIEKDLIHLCAKNIQSRKYGCIDLWPATEDRIRDLINNSIGGFLLEVFYDYKKEKPEHFDFIQYKLTKI